MPASTSSKPPLTRQVVRRSRIMAASGLTTALLALALLYFFNPVSAWFYPVCVLHQTTGLLCPGCGSLRAMHQLLHGNVATAFALNPLLVLSLPVLAAVSSRYLALMLRGRPVNIRPVWLWAALAVLTAFFIFRNLPLAQLARFQG